MTQCPHCAKPQTGSKFHSKIHEAACPKNPRVAAELRAFMHARAVDGYAIPLTVYTETKAEHGVQLPTPRLLVKTFGSYMDFVAWCGLKHRPSEPSAAHGLYNPCAMPGSVMSDDTMHHDPSCLRCVPVTRPVRRWDWRGKAWAVVGVQTAWQVR